MMLSVLLLSTEVESVKFNITQQHINRGGLSSASSKTDHADIYLWTVHFIPGIFLSKYSKCHGLESDEIMLVSSIYYLDLQRSVLNFNNWAGQAPGMRESEMKTELIFDLPALWHFSLSLCAIRSPVAMFSPDHCPWDNRMTWQTGSVAPRETSKWSGRFSSSRKSKHDGQRSKL